MTEDSTYVLIIKNCSLLRQLDALI